MKTHVETKPELFSTEHIPQSMMQHAKPTPDHQRQKEKNKSKTHQKLLTTF